MCIRDRPYTEHVAYLNEEMPKRMKQNRKRTGRIKDRKLKYFGHIIIAA